MTTKDVSKVFERVRSWPEARQEEAAHVLLEMEAQDASRYHLTDEQLAEVKRRRAKADPKFISLADARKRFRGFGDEARVRRRSSGRSPEHLRVDRQG